MLKRRAGWFYSTKMTVSTRNGEWWATCRETWGSWVWWMLGSWRWQLRANKGHNASYRHPLVDWTRSGESSPRVKVSPFYRPCIQICVWIFARRRLLIIIRSLSGRWKRINWTRNGYSCLNDNLLDYLIILRKQYLGIYIWCKIVCLHIEKIQNFDFLTYYFLHFSASDTKIQHFSN